MTAEEYVAKAARAIASASLLLDDGDVEGACNRAYYAMSDAAHAALMWAGVGVNPATTKMHRGLIAAVGLHLVKTSLLSAEFGKSLNQVERIRLLADYTGEDIDAGRARWAIEQARLFLTEVQEKLAPRPD